YFQRPADVNKMVFMVWKHAAADRDDDRWLYLPALDLVKRIAGAEKRTSFVGSDFFYEDVSGRGIGEDVHELAEITDNYYVLKNTPKDPSSVEFDHYLMWIHKDTFLPVKIEYYDTAGEPIREYAALGVETIAGFPTVTRSMMKNLKTGSRTEMSYSNVAYNIGLPDEIFSERYLRKPPREYLR
ncbi:MAG TPA: outer membrane lipoprotein-sorting protein, partial [bacterium]|nr:outer membrane lipoprotein-sorting protein [bacterium]